jgi:hypothetical protein
MFLGSSARPARRADCLDNVGSSISHNPIDLHGLLWGGYRESFSGGKAAGE